MTVPRAEEHLLTPQLHRVAERQSDSDDVVSLRFDVAPGSAGFGQPGQFNMLYAFGVGEVPISFSRCDAQKGHIWHTVRGVGPVSRALAALDVNDAVGIRGPFGTPWPLETMEGRDIVLMAGGLGLAPLRPVVDHVLRQREILGKIRLLYGARSPEALIYAPELEVWAEERGIEVKVTVDHAAAGWEGHVGVITTLLDALPVDPEKTMAMICGPGLMMRFSVSALEGLGCAEERLFVSMERNMKCAVGQCGRCQYGPYFICREGPVFRYDHIRSLFRISDI
ncbi:MAG: FAD/NAD(P)-binding protein [Parvibaculaceae bacterium]